MNEKLQSGVRFAAWPTEGQAQVFARWIGCQRFVYNAKVDEDRLFATQRRMVLRDDPSAQVRAPLDNTYAQFKDDELTPWLAEVPSVVLRQGVCRWRAAKQRQLAKLAQAPRRRNRLNFDSLRLDSDAFHFEQVTEPDGSCRLALFVGTKAQPLGELRFTAHRPFDEPKMLTIRRQSTGRWFVSFSYEHAVPEDFVQRTPAELAYEFDLLGDEALVATTLGLDRNVSDNAVATSDGRFFMPERIVLERLKRKEIGAKRQQRRLARQQKGSANRAKTKRRLARKHAYKTEALRDFSHQTSHAIANSDAQVVAVEALQIQNMTKRPKARFDDASGRWLKNGAAVKAGLNKAILSRAWGRIAEQLAYKLARQNKLLVQVAPQYSSQECSRCGHTHPDNRDEQRFVCQRCGYEAHADLNAAQNVKMRAVARIRSGELQKASKPKKRVAMRRRTDTGSGRPGVPAEPT
jgi:putative transposase